MKTLGWTILLIAVLYGCWAEIPKYELVATIDSCGAYHEEYQRSN